MTAPVPTQQILKEMSDDKKQWIHAARLLAGFESREEPAATSYFDNISDTIEKKHGIEWLNIVLNRFTEIQLLDEKHRAKKHENIKAM